MARRRTYKRWTAAEHALLRTHYPNTHTNALAAQLGRPRAAVTERARTLGLRKSPELLAQLYGEQTARLMQSCADSRFKQGMTPPNKGKRHPARGRTLETQFKRGNMPHTWVPVGTRRWRRGGWYVKVADTRNKQHDWQPLSHVLLAEAGRPVPPGYIVRYRDGNPGNLCLDNLEAISRAEHAQRNSPFSARYPPELQALIQQKAQLTRAIRRAEQAQPQPPTQPQPEQQP